jgi:type I restriction enzyme M protein
MITGELRNRIDDLWTKFWTGGITNPLTVIEQISFLMFARLLDINETRNEARAKRTKKDFKRIFPEGDAGQLLRWQKFKNLPGEKMLPHVRDKVFPFFRETALSGSDLGKYMADAQLLVQKESLLVQAVTMIDSLPLDEGDTKGDLYEYLLSKLTTAGINGQFRTPRHIIRLMVDLLDPKPTETVGDPACGTAGFLVIAMQYLMEKNTSADGIIEHELNGKVEKIFTGDLLEPYRTHIQNDMFHGFDFDSTMLRIAAMNLLLHGVDSPDIEYQDTLATSFSERYPKQSQDYFDVILANPPFKGSLDFEDTDSRLLAKVKTKKTELLFIVLILQMLKVGGRSATIVPDGVLFGSSKAHQDLRKTLIEDNQLDGIVSLPSGVFKPYAGVSTAIILFTKGGTTKNVWFYDLKNDGFTLDDKREKIGDGRGDLPDVLTNWKERDSKKDTDRKQRSFFVPADVIRKNKFDLSIGQYKEEVYEEVHCDPPKQVIQRLVKVETSILEDLKVLEELLS